MKVLKFGGTSVGSAARMKAVAQLICNGERNFVVLSAMSGTTNTLVDISNSYRNHNLIGALKHINTLEHKYYSIVSELYEDAEICTQAQKMVGEKFKYLRAFAQTDFTQTEEKIILAQGELLSTAMFQLYLQEKGADSVLLPALDFMRTDTNGEPDTDFISKTLNKMIAVQGNHLIYITQGYICKNYLGEIDNLQRGGSDYTASLIGAAIKSEEIQIWTDIDGMHNNDPRFVEGTKPVPLLHFEEAAELAYFGAKILHPTCILPAKTNSIPVRLLNTMQPDAVGTLISLKSEQSTIQAVAAKDGITAIKIKSGRMLLAYGFLLSVFEVFEKYRTPIDMITTSEVGVSVTIDNTDYLEKIISELKRFGTVTFDTDMAIICVVGDLSSSNIGIQAKAVEALKDIPLRMISYGGSNYNISFLVNAADKQNALRALSKTIF